MKDPIISVKDLLAECVRKAAPILVCGIICAIALCGFKYFKDVRAINQTSAEVEIEFTADQKIQIANYVNAVNQWNGLSEYLQNSIFINLNPYGIDSVQIQYRIDADSEDMKKDAVYAFRTYLLEGGLAEDLSQKDGTVEARYFNELIKCEPATKASQNYNSILQIDNGIIQVVMYAKNADDAKVYAAWVNECVDSYVKTINQKGLVCKIQKLDERQISIVDSKLSEEKTRRRLEYTDVTKIVNDLLPALSAEQLSAANSILDSDLESDLPSEEVKQTAGISLKFLVLGGILGCGLAVVWIAVVYIFTNTIKNWKDVQNMLGVTDLGYLTCRKQNVFDKIANKVFYPTENFDLEVQKTGVISKIIFCCKRNDVKDLILVNDAVKNIEVLEQMKAELTENGIACSIVEKLSVEKDAAKAKDVVLFNQMNKTKYQDVENEILFCKNQNINVLGYITVM